MLIKVLLKIAACALLGGFLGLTGGVGYACSGDNAGNLCGLFGFFLTGPIGFIAGGVFGVWWVARPRTRRSAPPTESMNEINPQ
jgi:hypothetical protein